MSTFEVPVLQVDDVYDHPNADRLSILKIRGYEAIANKHEDGSHRYMKGEMIIYVPEGAVVPDRHLYERGYWSEKDGKGMLAGSKGNRVKAISLRGVLSQGLVWKTNQKMSYDPEVSVIAFGNLDSETVQVGVGPKDPICASKRVRVGDNVAEFFNIVKYVPPVPMNMTGRMKALFEAQYDYDIEDLKAYPDIFQDGEEVVATEKLHGTFVRMTLIPDMNDPDLFGDGNVTITTKGMGAQGLVFLNIPENAGNLYVKALSRFTFDFQAAARLIWPDQTVHLMGEIFGPRVQDLNYGLQEPEFRAFDMRVGHEFLSDDAKASFFDGLGVPRVPVLYRGPFSWAKMEELAAGDTTIGLSPHIREGIVITAAGAQTKRTLALGRTMRPIAKLLSPAYLTRKGGTEFQ